MGSVRKILVQIFSRGRTSKEGGQGPEMNTAAENPTSFKSCAAKEANSTHGRNNLFFSFFLSYYYYYFRNPDFQKIYIFISFSYFND
jgi:hypothetical protein